MCVCENVYSCAIREKVLLRTVAIRCVYLTSIRFAIIRNGIQLWIQFKFSHDRELSTNVCMRNVMCFINMAFV